MLPAQSSLRSPRNFCLPFWSWNFVLFFPQSSKLKLVFSALIFVGANLLRIFLLPVAILLHEFKFLCKFCFGKHLYQYSSSASKQAPSNLVAIHTHIYIFSCVVDLCCSYNSSSVVVFGFGFWIILSIFGNFIGLFTFAMGIDGGGEARKHVCVTGNWGLLSSWLLRSLLERGYNVRSAIPKSAGAAKF